MKSGSGGGGGGVVRISNLRLLYFHIFMFLVPLSILAHCQKEKKMTSHVKYLYLKMLPSFDKTPTKHFI